MSYELFSPRSLGVAVCCYKGHIPFLERLLDSIAVQTRLPDEVVISCSSSEPDDIPSHLMLYAFPVRILTCSEQKNCAENRNRAAAALSTDLVSFMDADDLLHPRRIELVWKAFLAYPGTQLVVHDTRIIPVIDTPFEPVEDPVQMIPNRLYRCPWGSTQLYDPLPGMLIANGHASATRDAWAAVRFHETEEYRSRDDTIFCTDMITRWPNQTVYIHAVLSHYLPSGTGGQPEP